MSRRGDEAQFRELAELARLRELAALDELGRITLQMDRLNARIGELRSKRFSAANPEEANALIKWQHWRQFELQNLGTQLAALSHDRALASSRCGRLAAEREVVGKVIDKLRAKKRKDTERAQTYSASPFP